MRRKDMMRRVAAVALGVTLTAAGLMVPQSAGTASAKEAFNMVVKCQNTKGTNGETASTKLRLITGVDSLEYKQVGFDVKVGENQKSYETTTVYASVNAEDKTVTAAEFSTGSAYLAVAVLENIDKASYNEGIYVKPYVVTLEGEKVYGVDRYVRVANGYDGSFSVAVRLNDTDGIGAGLAYIDYDSDKLEYVGYDAGTVLEETTVSDTGSQVRFVSNLADVSKDTPATGMLINLNFKVKSYDPANASTYSFNIAKKEFCNVAEEDVTVESLTVDTMTK